MLELIHDVSERLERDIYITISDALYLLLKLLYEKLDQVDEFALGCDVASVVATAFKKKLMLDIDDVNKIYSWGLAAALEGRWQYLTWICKYGKTKKIGQRWYLPTQLIWIFERCSLKSWVAW